MPPGLRELTKALSTGAFVSVAIGLALFATTPSLVRRANAIDLHLWMQLDEATLGVARFAHESAGVWRVWDAPEVVLPSRDGMDAPTRIVGVTQLEMRPELRDMLLQLFGIRGIFGLRAVGPRAVECMRYSLVFFHKGELAIGSRSGILEGLDTLEPFGSGGVAWPSIDYVPTLVKMPERWKVTRLDLQRSGWSERGPSEVRRDDPAVVAYFADTLDRQIQMQSVPISTGFVYAGAGLASFVVALFAFGPLVTVAANRRQNVGCDTRPVASLLVTLDGVPGVFVEMAQLAFSTAVAFAPVALLAVQLASPVTLQRDELTTFRFSAIGYGLATLIYLRVAYELFRARNGPAFRATHPEYFADPETASASTS